MILLNEEEIKCSICGKNLVKFKDDLGVSTRHETYDDFVACSEEYKN